MVDDTASVVDVNGDDDSFTVESEDDDDAPAFSIKSSTDDDASIFSVKTDAS